MLAAAVERRASVGPVESRQEGCHGDWRDRRLDRAARPPRRFFRRCVREGSSSTISVRSLFVMWGQSRISSMVRMQPMQTRALGWMVHMFTQGDCISSRCQISLCMAGTSPICKAIQCALQDIPGGDVVDNLCAALS